MLAINIDGTLLQSNGKLHKSTKEAIEYVQKKGVYVTLVTSRTFPSAKKIAKALKVNTNLITHRGAYIAKEVERPVYSSRIKDSITYDLVQLLEGFPCQIRLVHEHFSLANKYKLEHKLLSVKPSLQQGMRWFILNNLLIPSAAPLQRNQRTL